MCAKQCNKFHLIVYSCNRLNCHVWKALSRDVRPLTVSYCVPSTFYCILINSSSNTLSYSDDFLLNKKNKKKIVRKCYSQFSTEQTLRGYVFSSVCKHRWFYLHTGHSHNHETRNLRLTRYKKYLPTTQSITETDCS